MGLWNKVKKAAKDTKKAFKDAFQNTTKDTLDSVDKASNSTRQWAGVQKKPNGQD
jgi:hypothetical protein